jgi:hypothetical protein
MLDAKSKLALQRQASALKKDIQGAGDVRQRLALQRQWSAIIKQLKGQEVSPEAAAIDAAANEAATGDNDLPEPTEAQKIAGNYKKGRVTFAGIDITIENPKGSVRSGTAEDGSTWSTTMLNHYGDIRGTKGADDDPIDVFLGEVLEPETVFVIDQINPDTLQFDEHKVMLGFDSISGAKKAYLANYDKGWRGLGAIRAYDMDTFKAWVYGGQKNEPVKYSSGDLPILEAETTERAQLIAADYQDMDALKLKQSMLVLDQQGYTVPELVPVMDHWLQINVANGQYIREQMAS